MSQSDIHFYWQIISDAKTGSKRWHRILLLILFLCGNLSFFFMAIAQLGAGVRFLASIARPARDGSPSISFFLLLYRRLPRGIPLAARVTLLP